ncbi:MAG: 50S ribosomal protein L15 [Chlorobi bacterium]|nr:50S ribosomal protein L15 [Chlorobiota bacterium]
MSLLSNLRPSRGSVKRRKRVGRGNASGKGTTAGRGNKGAQSRSGYSLRPGFAGGNLPLHLKYPKRGFNPPKRKEYVSLNLAQLVYFVEKYGLNEVSPEILAEKGLIKKKKPLKVLGVGEWTVKVPVKAHAFSKSAIEKIKAAGIEPQIIKA